MVAAGRIDSHTKRWGSHLGAKKIAIVRVQGDDVRHLVLLVLCRSTQCGGQSATMHEWVAGWHFGTVSAWEFRKQKW